MEPPVDCDNKIERKLNAMRVNARDNFLET